MSSLTKATLTIWEIALLGLMFGQTVMVQLSTPQAEIVIADCLTLLEQTLIDRTLLNQPQIYVPPNLGMPGRREGAGTR